MTGNSEGSYYVNDEGKAREAVDGAEELIKEAIEEFCIPAQIIADHLFDYDYWDVTIRCLLLNEAIGKVRERCSE